MDAASFSSVVMHSPMQPSRSPESHSELVLAGVAKVAPAAEPAVCVPCPASASKPKPVSEYNEYKRPLPAEKYSLYGVAVWSSRTKRMYWTICATEGHSSGLGVRAGLYAVCWPAASA